MVIEDKYVRMIGKRIYSKELDKHGFINSIEIMFGHSGVIPLLRAFFDTFDSNAIVGFDDFTNGKVKFEVFRGMSELDNLYEQTVKDVKSIFGEEYSDDMIIQFDHSKWDEMQNQQHKRNKQRLFTDLVSLTDISADVFYNDFYTQGLYLKYKKGVLTETEMLYAVVNYLCCEHKRLADKNLEYFSKYELKNICLDCCCDTANDK